MKISQMPLSTTPSSDDVLAMLEGGTQNRKITFGAVAEWIANEEEIDNLNTDNKTIVGAVNELEELIGDATADTQAKIKNLQDTAYVTNTASGDIAAFSDGTAADAKSVVIHVEPVQAGSGDPSPDNVRPISGRTGATVWRTGKNLIPNIKYQEAETRVVLGYNSADFSLFLPRGTYTLSVDFVDNAYAGAYYRFESDSTNRTIWISTDTITSATFIIDKDERFRLWLYAGNGITVNDIENFMVSASTTANNYTPYTGSTIPVSWETEAGTVYGAELDVVSGKLTVDRAMNVYDGSEDENWSYYNISTGNLFRTIIADRTAENITGVSNQAKYLCNSYTVAANESTGRTTGHFSGANKNADFVNDNFTTVESWQTNLANHPLQFIFPLAEPVTYQLTPQQIQTLLGENKIWSDAGSVSVEYRADAKSYINSLFSSIQGNIAFIEDGTTASRAYTAGQYVIVGGTMYKVSAAIASGAEFTPDTNIVATTVGTELTALNA